MSKESYCASSICLNVMLSVSVLVHLSQAASFCVEHYEISQCSSSSTWSFDVGSVNATHLFQPGIGGVFEVSYTLTLTNSSIYTLCTYQFIPSGVCNERSGSNCISCSYDVTNLTVTSLFSITDLQLPKNRSRLEYNIVSTGPKQPLQELTITGCDKSVGNAIASNCSDNNSEDICGYNCECQFDCKDGFTTGEDTLQSYRCNAAAEWDDEVFTCDPDLGSLFNALVGLLIAGPISICIFCGFTYCLTKKIGIPVDKLYIYEIFVCCTDKIKLYLFIIIIVVPWIISLILCLAASGNGNAVLAGIVLASISCGCMAVVDIILFTQICVYCCGGKRQ